MFGITSSKSKERRGLEGGDDVRAANRVLGQLGIPVRRAFCDQDKQANKLVVRRLAN
jgi:hypothetical protein